MTSAIAREAAPSSAASPYIGDPQSVEIMRTMDERLSPQCRALVHEYGWVIVSKSLDEMDWPDADALRRELQIWREREQQKWLRTDYVTPRLRKSFNVVGLSAEMEKVRKRRALKVASREKLRRMMLDEADRASA